MPEKVFQAALAGVNGRTLTTGMSMVHLVDTLVFVTLGPLMISTMGIATMSLALLLWGAAAWWGRRF